MSGKSVSDTAESDGGAQALKMADCACGHAVNSHDAEGICWAGECECDNDRWQAMYAAGMRLTLACEACNGSGLYPNPTGVFYAPTERLGCGDCMGAGRVLPPGEVRA